MDLQSINSRCFNIDALPKKMYCTNDFAYGVRLFSKQTALKRANIGINTSRHYGFLLFDLDYQGSVDAWQDKNMPTPNWIATNRENGHSHYGYTLAFPVSMKERETKAAQYLKAIDSQMRKGLDADKSYSAQVTKNPLSEQWLVFWMHDQPYELSDFLEYVNLPALHSKQFKKILRESDQSELGRNGFVFEELSQFAYSEIRKHRLPKGGHNTFLFRSYCEEFAESINNNFAVPLGKMELKSIIRSVTDFCLRYDHKHQQQFQAKQAFRGRLGGIGKGKANENKRASALLMETMGMNPTEIAAELGVSRQTIYNWMKSRPHTEQMLPNENSDDELFF